jgi:hypothetical protein
VGSFKRSGGRFGAGGCAAGNGCACSSGAECDGRRAVRCSFHSVFDYVFRDSFRNFVRHFFWHIGDPEFHGCCAGNNVFF